MEDVSFISVRHLIWKVQIWNNDDIQISYDCLLNDSAHLVLIRPETVTNLGLPICHLSEPVSISFALNDASMPVTELWNYVSLSLSSLNNAWSSYPVCALITPGLCLNILLGLPFLAHNKIVIDHEAHTAVDKSCGFDLLNGNMSCHHASSPLCKSIPSSETTADIETQKIVIL